ncbi:TPA: glycosyltransferase family 2 protein [Streptococcus suis]
MLVLKVCFWISTFLIFWANIGYPLSILCLDKLIKKEVSKKQNYEPTVTVMVVAHNEEAVIAQKMDNLLLLDYPKDKLRILVTSDNSTDATNEIVQKYVEKHSNISLYLVQKRLGKTNAQNEAAKMVSSEILVMTDANAMLDVNAVKELVSSFEDNVAYVTGKLMYSNHEVSKTSHSENKYWDLDTRIREIESRLQTITAGNGALYAVRTEDFVEFDPIVSHDLAMPVYYNLQGKRAVANHSAVAFEKAGQVDSDEFKRKVRMSRVLLRFILPSIAILNVIKYRWFSYFYFGHRTARYLLWFNHIIAFLCSLFLMQTSVIYLIAFCIQVLVFLTVLGRFQFNIQHKFVQFSAYYCMTVYAQFVGVVRTILGKNKPFWDKAESTR